MDAKAWALIANIALIGGLVLSALIIFAQSKAATLQDREFEKYKVDSKAERDFAIEHARGEARVRIAEVEAAAREADRIAEQRIADVTKETAVANASAGAAKAAAAQANEAAVKLRQRNLEIEHRIADGMAETAAANAAAETAKVTAALANESTEKLRRRNLEIERSLQPRRLFPARGVRYGMPSDAVMAMAKSLEGNQGIEVVIQPVPDVEAENLAANLADVLQKSFTVSIAGEAKTGVKPIDIPSGVLVRAGNLYYPWQKLSVISKRLSLALTTLLNSDVRLIPMNSPGGPYPSFSSDDQIIYIGIGPNPVVQKSQE